MTYSAHTRTDSPESGDTGGVRSVTRSLVAAGLDDAEAEAFTHLSRNGPTRAANLASHLGWPRSKAYRVLESMQGRGLVIASMDRPIEFRAVPPDALFRRLEDAQRAHLTMVQQARGTVLPLLNDWADRTDGGSTMGGSFTVLKGQVSVMRALMDALAPGLTSVDVHLPSKDADRIPGGPEILGGLAAMVEGGATVRAIQGPDAAWDLPAGIKCRVNAETKVPAFAIIDNQRVLFSVPGVDVHARASQHYMSTDASGVAASYKQLFQSLWDRGTDE